MNFLPFPIIFCTNVNKFLSLNKQQAMGQKKEVKRLKKRIKNIERGFKRHKKNTDQHFNSLESLLTEFNEKLTAVLTIKKKSENGIHKVEKAPAFKKK